MPSVEAPERKTPEEEDASVCVNLRQHPQNPKTPTLFLAHWEGNKRYRAKRLKIARTPAYLLELDLLRVYCGSNCARLLGGMLCLSLSAFIWSSTFSVYRYFGVRSLNFVMPFVFLMMISAGSAGGRAYSRPSGCA